MLSTFVLFIVLTCCNWPFWVVKKNSSQPLSCCEILKVEVSHIYLKMKFSSSAFVEPWGLWTEWALRTYWRDWVFTNKHNQFIRLHKFKCICGQNMFIFDVYARRWQFLSMSDSPKRVHVHLCVEFLPVLQFKALSVALWIHPNIYKCFNCITSEAMEVMNFSLVHLIADLMLILIDYSPNKVLRRLQLSFLWRSQVELLQLNVMKLWTNHILSRVGCV